MTWIFQVKPIFFRHASALNEPLLWRLLSFRNGKGRGVRETKFASAYSDFDTSKGDVSIGGNGNGGSVTVANIEEVDELESGIAVIGEGYTLTFDWSGFDFRDWGGGQ